MDVTGGIEAARFVDDPSGRAVGIVCDALLAAQSIAEVNVAAAALDRLAVDQPAVAVRAAFAVALAAVTTADQLSVVEDEDGHERPAAAGTSVEVVRDVLEAAWLQQRFEDS